MEGVIRTRVGYAGGTETSPSYLYLGNHSETIQIDYNPGIISYADLLEVFWNSNEAVILDNSRQYYSIIFYHDDEQKNLAMQSYEKRINEGKKPVPTEIVPYSQFNRAEDYHQKFYLQREKIITKDLLSGYDLFTDFVDSTQAARLNGYIGGYGDVQILKRDIDTFGLSAAGKERLLKITGF